MHGHTTGDEPLPNEGPTNDEIDRDAQSVFMESFNTTIVSDSSEGKEIYEICREKTPTLKIKGGVKQCLESFRKVSQIFDKVESCVIQLRSKCCVIQLDCYWYSQQHGRCRGGHTILDLVEVRKSKKKNEHMLWLQMSKATRLTWCANKSTRWIDFIIVVVQTDFG